MNQNSTLNARLANLQLNKLKSWVRDNTEVALKI